MSGQTYYRGWEIFWDNYEARSEPPVLADEFPEDLISSSQRILEIGFGSGRVLRHFSKRGYRIFGVDIVRSAYRMLRAMHGEESPEILRHICLSSCSNLSFRSGCFGTVICLGILEHFQTKAEISRALQEIKRVMRDDALAVISLPHRYSAFIAIEFIKRLTGNWHSGLENKFTSAQFISLARQEGLRCRHYYFRSMDITPARGVLRIPAHILKLFDMFLVQLRLGGHMVTYLLEKDEQLH
jgi:SAM-dependent methyltransferase